MAKYKTSGSPPTNEARAENTSECESYVSNKTEKITLKHGMGQMTMRSQPAIIRYHQWSLRKQPEQYFHAQLLLYFP